MTGSGTGLSEQRRNYATNPSYEVNTTGSVRVGAGSFNRSTTRAWVGTSSGLITFGAGGAVTQGVNITVAGLAVGDQYTASVYLYVPAASLGANVSLRLSGTAFTSSAISTADTWVRASLTFTATANTHTLAILNNATTTSGWTTYVDGLFVEEGAGPTTYFDGATTDTGSSTTLGATVYDWVGTAHASQSIQSLVVEGYTITATVEPGNVPQRVRVDVSAAGSSLINAVTVTRTDPSGAVVPVRTEDGEPLTLVVSSGVKVGTVYDYEMPYGQPVTYATTQQPAVATDPVTVAEDRIWLIHPGVPDRSVVIELTKGSLDEESEDVIAGVFFPLGRRNAVVLTDGRRKAPSGTLIVDTVSPAERWALADLLSDAFPLLLNVPPSTGMDIDTCYVHIGAIRRTRPSDVGSELLRRWVLPFQVVDAPVGGSQSLRTWQDVLDENATWQAVLDNYATWGDVQAPTT